MALHVHRISGRNVRDHLFNSKREKFLDELRIEVLTPYFGQTSFEETYDKSPGSSGSRRSTFFQITHRIEGKKVWDGPGVWSETVKVINVKKILMIVLIIYAILSYGILHFPDPEAIAHFQKVLLISIVFASSAMILPVYFVSTNQNESVRSTPGYKDLPAGKFLNSKLKLISLTQDETGTTFVLKGSSPEPLLHSSSLLEENTFKKWHELKTELKKLEEF